MNKMRAVFLRNDINALRGDINTTWSGARITCAGGGQVEDAGAQIDIAVSHDHKIKGMSALRSGG